MHFSFAGIANRITSEFPAYAFLLLKMPHLRDSYYGRLFLYAW